MRALGVVKQISAEGALLKLTVALHGELVQDVIATAPGRIRYNWRVDDLCWVFGTEGTDADRYAEPLAISVQSATLEFGTEQAVVVIDGAAVEARTPSGTAKSLITKEEHDALRNWVAAQFTGIGHVHATGVGPTTSTTPATQVPPAPTPPVAQGTQVLKGE